MTTLPRLAGWTLAFTLCAFLSSTSRTAAQGSALTRRTADAPRSATALPSGFVDEFVTDTSGVAVGLTFDGNGRMYLWERGGVVRVVERGSLLSQPLIDLSDEVGDWRDFGLLGFALDPNFLQNGYLYLYYVVDRHHLRFAGTPSYNPGTNEYRDATIGRITRYTADPGTGFTTAIPSSRKVLLGESAFSGVPILHQSHGTGSLMFGEDGTLLATSGDGASYSSTDTGSASETYYARALADGIIRPEENVGSFRSQMLGSLNGKVLRLDPFTGDGVSSNPFYDPANPRSPESRTWALGLRNPFRAALVPGTGQTDPAAGDPGTLMIGDVGYTQWEDLHVVDEPGMNLGWPLFEGITPLSAYQNARTANLDAPNPLGCASYFDFQDLLKQEQADHNPAFPNPCSPSVTIAPGTPTFMHRRPDIAWRHGSRSPKTYVPIFNGNQAAEAVLGSSGSPVAGTPFNGNCAVGGVLHSGRGMPAPYAGAYYVADYDKDWIRAFVYDSSGPQMALQEVLDFATPDGPVFVGEDPADGSLLYITIRRGEVRRIRYAGGVNQAPEPALVADTAHGATPLTVAFDGSTSLDPEGRPLSFAWDFGDGATSNQPSPRHTYRASVGGTAPTARVVTLTVTDDAGQSRTAVRVIGVNNTPPTVDITSPIAGSTYSTAATTLLSLNASVSDAEDPTSALGYVWEVFLHHNSHFHPDAISLNPSTTKVITPTPCSGEFYAYRVRLTVTDTVGQKGVDEVWLYPDCSSSATASVTLTTAGSVYPGQSVPLTASPAGAFDTVSFYDGATFLGEVQAAPFQLTWTPDQPGPASLSALVRALDGSSAASSGAIVDVLAPTREYARVTASDQDAEEKLSNGYMRVTNPDLELTIDRGFQQLIGLRLPVDVPPGSHISDAYVQFHVDEVDSAPTNLTIRAEATGTPAPITSARADLSSRPKTAARVDWAPGPWAYERAAGARQRTPNLAPIVQELVDRPDWSNPGTILLLIEGVGDRVAEAFDGVPSRSPELVIKYGGGINGPPVVNAGPDFLTPLGAAATVAGTATDDGLPAGVLNVTWTQEAGPGTAALGDPTATTTTVTFDVAGTYTLRLTADDGELQASDDVVVTVSPASVQTLDLQITAGSEDAEERIDTGYMVVSNVDLELGQDRSRPHVLGLRFALGVDPGATITTAWLQFTADEVGTGLCSVAIAAEATDDAPPIASRKRDLSSRPTTASSVPWEPLAWTTVGAAGAAERSPDLRDVLQEVVARPGWQRGNHVILLIRGTGTRTAESVEGSAPRAPVLHVEFL